MLIQYYGFIGGLTDEIRIRFSTFSYLQYHNLHVFVNQESPAFPIFSEEESNSSFDRNQGYNNQQLETINGKWSMIDVHRNSLILMRDFVGISPLYYTSNPYFSFSNRLDFLVSDTNISKNIDYNSLGDFLIFNKIDKGSNTLYHQIKEVPEGHLLRINLKNNIIEAISYRKDSSNNLPQHPMSKIIALHYQNFNEYIRTQIPTSSQGVLLSGGLDSSVIACALEENGVKNLTYLTASYPFFSQDEKPWAAMVANKFKNSSWQVVQPNPSSIVDDLVNMHREIDFPTISTGTLGQYLLLKKCKELGINNIWDGLGADAIYGGHDYYRYQLFYQYLTNFRPFMALKLLQSEKSIFQELLNSQKYWVKKFLRNTSIWQTMTDDNSTKLYNPDFLNEYYKNRKSNFPLNELQGVKRSMHNDFFHGGVRHLSRFTDRIASKNGLKMIYPYAENVKLAQWILSLNKDKLFHSGTSKYILRESYKHLLPTKIYQRRTKWGTPSPNNQWIDDYKDIWIDIFDDTLSDIYQINYIKNNYKKWWSVSGKRENYSIFKHISFAIWYRHISQNV